MSPNPWPMILLWLSFFSTFEFVEPSIAIGWQAVGRKSVVQPKPPENHLLIERPSQGLIEQDNTEVKDGDRHGGLRDLEQASQADPRNFLADMTRALQGCGVFSADEPMTTAIPNLADISLTARFSANHAEAASCFRHCQAQGFAATLPFVEARRRALAQPEQVYIEYGQQWALFNNRNRIDEKGDCYHKHPKPFEQVLILDSQGIVTDIIADQDNDKSRCFRDSYLRVQFPPPPVAPFYLHLHMQ